MFPGVAGGGVRVPTVQESQNYNLHEASSVKCLAIQQMMETLKVAVPIELESGWIRVHSIHYPFVSNILATN